MKIKKVNNNLNLFLIRYLLLILFCYLTLFVTGRIADMDVLLGRQEYYASGLSTQFAKDTYSLIANWGNSYLIILLLGFILTCLIYVLIKNLIDDKNKTIWITTLLSPGLLIYTNSPTKETLFFYPAIVFIILETNYINSKNSINILNIFFKSLILLLLFIIRGDQSFPYLIISLISFFSKTFKVGKIVKKIKINSTIFKIFILSLLVNIIISNLFPGFIENTSTYISQGLDIENNIYRPNQLDAYSNPLNILRIQFLSLFPTPGELLNKPYKAIVIIDSLLLIYSFKKSWELLFCLVEPYKILKKQITIMFTFIMIVYFSIYGIIGSINLGSSQRFRINYIPLGIIFPLILEKKMRDKQKIISLQNS